MYNFKYYEVIKSNVAKKNKIDNTLPNRLNDNLMRSAHGMQTIRDLLNVPLKINSWYRCNKLNNMVGGATNSSHKLCLAIDFVPIGMKIERAYKLISDSDLDFDQLILEHSGKVYWIHISFNKKNRKQIFKLKK